MTDGEKIKAVINRLDGVLTCYEHGPSKHCDEPSGRIFIDCEDRRVEPCCFHLHCFSACTEVTEEVENEIQTNASI
jgi:hypothetical protein